MSYKLQYQFTLHGQCSLHVIQVTVSVYTTWTVQFTCHTSYSISLQ